MRCPDCNKFVSMENADPDVDVESSLEGHTISVTGSIRAVRTCAECGTELKELSFDIDEKIEIEALEGFKELSADDQQLVKGILSGDQDLPEGNTADDYEIECDVEDGETSTDESGGRGKKNMLITNVTMEIKVTFEHPSGSKIKIQGHKGITSENAASSYDEV